MRTKKLLTLLCLFTLLVPVLPGNAQNDGGVSYYITDDAAYATALPNGWVVTGSRDEGLFVASSEEMMNLMLTDADSNVPSGEFGMLVLSGPIEDLETWDPVTFVDELVTELADPEETQWGEAYEVEIDRRTFGLIDANNENTDAIAVGFEIAPRTWGAGFLFAAPGEGETMSELGLALLSVVAYSLPLDDTIEGFFGTNYLVPTGWVGGEFEGVFEVANSEEALEADEPESGQFRLALLEWDGADVEDTADTLISGSLKEGQTAQPLRYLMVGKQEVLLVTVRDEDDFGIGGLFVIDGPDGEPDLVAIYQSAPGETQLIGLTALNLLLNSQVAAETD